jgi:hypothetical protein
MAGPTLTSALSNSSCTPLSRRAHRTPGRLVPGFFLYDSGRGFRVSSPGRPFGCYGACDRMFASFRAASEARAYRETVLLIAMDYIRFQGAHDLKPE